MILLGFFLREGSKFIKKYRHFLLFPCFQVNLKETKRKQKSQENEKRKKSLRKRNRKQTKKNTRKNLLPRIFPPPYFVLWWRSGFDLSLVIRDPEIESFCRNALQGRRRDLSSQEASLIWYNTIQYKKKNFNLKEKKIQVPET